jgi:hypothetical protein
MPKDTIIVMNPAIGSDHNVPADELSVKLIPIEDPVPSQVQVRVKERAPRDHKENCLGISLLYPTASSSRSSIFAWLEGKEDMFRV